MSSQVYDKLLTPKRMMFMMTSLVLRGIHGMVAFALPKVMNHCYPLFTLANYNNLPSNPHPRHWVYMALPAFDPGVWLGPHDPKSPCFGHIVSLAGSPKWNQTWLGRPPKTWVFLQKNMGNSCVHQENRTQIDSADWNQQSDATWCDFQRPVSNSDLRKRALTWQIIWDFNPESLPNIFKHRMLIESMVRKCFRCFAKHTLKHLLIFAVEFPEIDPASKIPSGTETWFAGTSTMNVPARNVHVLQMFTTHR